MTRASLLVPHMKVAALSVLLAGCSVAGRDAPPEALVAEARIDGYERIRFWGDQVSPEIKAVISRQYGQVRDAAKRNLGVSIQRATFLAISGGGGDGAFGAGILKGWSERGNRPKFEVVTGVSTGALSAVFAFLGSDYDSSLEAIYTTYGDRDLYTGRGLLGFLSEAINDTAPLERLIETYVTDELLDRLAAEYELGRRLLVQTTNIDAQRPVIWDLTAIAASGRQDRQLLTVRILLASTAIPAIFPAVRVPVVTPDGRHFEELHVDGGVSSQIFFAPPQVSFSQFERAFFGRERGRSLYVIRNGKLAPEYKVTANGTVDLATRSISTLIKQQSLADLRRLERASRMTGGHLSYVAIPATFGEPRASEFDTRYMRQLFEAGREAGLRGDWIQAPPAGLALAY